MTEPEQKIKESEDMLARHAGHIPSVVDDLLYRMLKQVLSNQVTLLREHVGK